MPSPRVSKHLNNKTYFLTLTVKNWYYVFDRYERWDILANSLNHIHLIINSPDVSGFIRDLKRHTSVQIRKNLQHTEPKVLKLFLNKRGKFEFWEKTNMPKIVESESFYLQKMNYIIFNPVKKNYVMKAEHWYWSSANELSELKTDSVA